MGSLWRGRQCGMPVSAAPAAAGAALTVVALVWLSSTGRQSEALVQTPGTRERAWCGRSTGSTTISSRCSCCICPTPLVHAAWVHLLCGLCTALAAHHQHAMCCRRPTCWDHVSQRWPDCKRRCVTAWRVMQMGWLPLGWFPPLVCRAAQQPRAWLWGCRWCPDTPSGPPAPTVALWGSSDACSCHARPSGNGRRAGSSSSSSMCCHGHTGTHCLIHHALWWLAPPRLCETPCRPPTWGVRGSMHGEYAAAQ